MGQRRFRVCVNVGVSVGLVSGERARAREHEESTAITASAQCTERRGSMGSDASVTDRFYPPVRVVALTSSLVPELLILLVRGVDHVVVLRRQRVYR